MNSVHAASAIWEERSTRAIRSAPEPLPRTRWWGDSAKRSERPLIRLGILEAK